MTEPFDRLSAAFTDLAASVLPEVDLPGPDTAHATVRRRRRRRIAVVAAVVAVVVLAPATALALLRGSGNTGPDIGTTTPPPSPTVSPTPTASPSLSPTASPQPAGLRAITDAALGPPTPLDDALLPMPPFPDRAEGCPVGETQYTDGIWQGSMITTTPPTHVRSWIHKVATGDVNGDGAADWIAGIACEYGVDLGSFDSQVVAFTRYGNGAYELLGPVIVLEPGYRAGPAEVAVDGIVRVAVGGPYEGAPPTPSAWRSFRWNGTGFAPVGSPVLIPIPEPSNLTLAVAPATISSPTTVLTVTVHNVGTTSSDYMVLSFRAGAALSILPRGFPADLEPNRASDCPVERPILDESARCTWTLILEPVPPGQSATGQFTVFGADMVSVREVDVNVEGVVVGAPGQRNATTMNSVSVPIETG